ncbi:MAG: DUF4381 domain-containing protein [Gammaproteobacteria bacterium]|nr:DUF4381 domain-containing protein [Gammaproteobacteria bacterium]
MNSPDPASLQNLNDIVLPAPASWWPLASGWYVLLGLLALVIAWFSYRSIKRWNQNRYRRAALHELAEITKGLELESKRERYLRQIPGLLKRTALTAYPRSEVASLSGEDWHRFLNGTLKTPLFTASISATLERISYSGGDLNKLDSGSVGSLLNVSGRWLRQHQPAAGMKGRQEV